MGIRLGVYTITGNYFRGLFWTKFYLEAARGVGVIRMMHFDNHHFKIILALFVRSVEVEIRSF